jgi:hypothetical protein
VIQPGASLDEVVPASTFLSLTVSPVDVQHAAAGFIESIKDQLAKTMRESLKGALRSRFGSLAD